MIETNLKCPLTGLPVGEAKAALGYVHFPVRYQAVIWRNWGVVTAARLAAVLKMDVCNIEESARALGLGEGASVDGERLWLQRGYITLIRSNWHLLPYVQLLELLGWEPKRLAYTLKEDDFLWNKLGNCKPVVEPVEWEELSVEQAQQTGRLRKWVGGVTERLAPRVVEPFQFLGEYGSAVAVAGGVAESGQGLRLVYSHSAVYGDPLLDAELDPYPDAMLAALAKTGVNAVWLQGVLYTLVPWLDPSHDAGDCAARLRSLNALVEKAAAHGIRVYLYLNEPRGMPAEFFRDHPEWQGAYFPRSDLYALCTANPEVLQKLQQGVARLIEQVPGLGGVFTISMSENLTHCHSKFAAVSACPRCAGRSTAEIVAEVNNAIADGVHSVNPKADVIVWAWSWDSDWGKDAIDRLRPGIKLMCTSESLLPTNAMGVEGYVSDYSMSKVGPGPQATEFWAHARSRGLTVLAKVQMNSTWECSAVPYLPVPFLVRDHLRNLREHSVSGVMAAWTLGGYPGGNLMLFDSEPEAVALELYGDAAADVIIEAWRTFGRAFTAFPLHGARCLYRGPQNYGPANLLFAEPTGRTPTMLGFPYDDLDSWRGNHFPVDVFEAQFRQLSEGWADGLELLARAAELVPADKAAHLADLVAVAEAAYCHFRSTYLQIRYIHLRDGDRSGDVVEEMAAVLGEEIELAKRLIDVIRRDSRIGFEASNHYYYSEQSLLEKVINCESLREQLRGNA